ncbi:MAG TPA: START domain-containing protein [Mucilaginibacter sp.]|nr:START domain-containing protein [Mucilaginibacter sp.]
MFKKFVPLLILIAFSSLSRGQNSWQLVRDDDGIAVYTRRLPSEKFKEVKANFELNATEDQLISILQNIPHHKDWSYGTKRTFLISRKNKDTLIYYSEVSLPWPLSNRDLVIQLSFKKDTMDHTMRIQAKSIPGILPVNPGLVRVPFSLAQWDVKVLPNKSLQIQYTLSTDPGGAIPAWLVNFAASVGPYNSFKKLRELIHNKSNNNSVK